MSSLVDEVPTPKGDCSPLPCGCCRLSSLADEVPTPKGDKDTVQPTRVFKSREIEAFLGEVHDQRAIASPSRASLQKMAAQSIGADNVVHEDRDIGQAR